MALRKGNEAVAAQQDIGERNLGRTRRIIVNIRPFYCKEDKDISEWLIRWEIAPTANDWTPDQQLTMIPAYLAGRVARIFWKMSRETKKP